MKFYQSKEFKRIQGEWRKRLEAKGFKDLEDLHENLKNHDIRTIAWENREQVLDFFLSLERFMNSYDDMPKFERRVMELYAQGTYVKTIVKQLKSSDRHVRNVIRRYKGLVLAINRMMIARADFPQLLSPSKLNADSKGTDGNDPGSNQAA